LCAILLRPLLGERHRIVARSLFRQLYYAPSRLRPRKALLARGKANIKKCASRQPEGPSISVRGAVAKHHWTQTCAMGFFWAHIEKSAKGGWEMAAAKIMPVGGERQWLREPHPAASPRAGDLLPPKRPIVSWLDHITSPSQVLSPSKLRRWSILHCPGIPFGRDSSGLPDAGHRLAPPAGVEYP
jgi:hypothetical protein